MSGSEYLLWSYGQFEKMTFFPPDPLSLIKAGTGTGAWEALQDNGMEEAISDG
jgi:hypothetical protein